MYIIHLYNSDRSIRKTIFKDVILKITDVNVTEKINYFSE